MKHFIRYFYVLAALLLPPAGAWADSVVNVITQVDGMPATAGGQVTAQVADDGTCTLTAQPAAGYFITAGDIGVMKLVAGNQAQARHRAPALAEPIALTPVDVDDPSAVTTYRFVMPGEEYDVEVTADFHPCGIVVDRVPVTAANRLDVLGDGGSVQYDGSSVLLLRDATLAYGIKSSVEQLTVLLEGTSSILTDGTAIMSLTDNAALTFRTDGNPPGKLTLRNTQDEAGRLIANFSRLLLDNNLAVLEGTTTGTYAAVGTPVRPFVDNSDKEEVVSMTDIDTGDLRNSVIQNVLYTLQDEDYALDGDCIILESTMVEDDVDGIVKNYTPGTDDYADRFSGLTFLLPAGTGRIILTARTGESGVLCVKIGNSEPYVVRDCLDFTEVTLPYACVEDTYVRIYNASDVVNPARKRAGKKTTITVGIRNVGVTADAVQTSNMAANVSAGVVPLTASDVSYHAATPPTGGTAPSPPSITVAHAPAANGLDELPEGFFSDFGYASYIDLRETSLAGMEVSRSAGPFKDVSPNTFIFLPAGNTCADNEPNVVIGTVCGLAVLDGNMPEGEAFEIAGEFTAQQVVLDRQFAKDELTTVYLPFAVDQQTAAASGAFYIYDRMENGYVKVCSQETGLEAHTPALFKPAADDVQIVGHVAKLSMPEEPVPARRMEPAPARRMESVPVRRMEPGIDDTMPADGLYGCYAHTQATDGAFRLLPTTDFKELSFIRMAAGEATPPFQCYLQASGLTDDVLKVTDKEGTATALHAVHALAAEADQWLTVSGLRVSKPTAKGVYIYKGKKQVVR